MDSPLNSIRSVFWYFRGESGSVKASCVVQDNPSKKRYTMNSHKEAGILEFVKFTLKFNGFIIFNFGINHRYKHFFHFPFELCS